jgi:hypothetical protein
MQIADTVFLPAKVQEKWQGFLCLAVELDQNVKYGTYGFIWKIPGPDLRP